MKTALTLLAAFVICTVAPSQSNAQGLFSKLRDKVTKDKGSSIAPAELESRASASFAKAEDFEKSGRTKQARDLYRSITRSYPNTTVGAESQFRLAQIRDREGDGSKAYDEYQTLITKYRSSPHFQTAIERQFAIAENLRNQKRKGIFGIGAGIQPSELIEMYDQISDAAPYTEYAPRSLMSIAALNAKDDNKPAALSNYQSVVDNYRGTPFAKEAQYEIYKLRGEAAANSNSPSEDRAQVDAGLNFVAQNPTDTRADVVKSDLEAIELRSLEKMFKTGKFYEETGKHKSALVYYREIAKKPNSKHFTEATQRIDKINRILAGEEIEEKANLFGSLPQLPALPKIAKPKFRIGNKDEVVPLPAEEIIEPLNEPNTTAALPAQ